VRERAAQVLFAGLVGAALLGAVLTIAFVGSRHGIAAWLESPDVAVGMAWAAPGLFCFALNKVLLAATNGLRRMRAFAVLNGLRYLLLLVGLFVAMALGFDGARLGFVFSFAEGLLLLCLAFEVGGVLAGLRRGGISGWAGVHLVYGAKSVVSGMLLELNSRVDVLMIGRFLGDGPVGIYAFASTLAEGFFQLLVVLQHNYNPLIARSLTQGAHEPGPAQEEFHAMVQRGKRTTYLWMTLAAALSVAGYPLYVMLVGRPEFWASWLPFGVLVAGMWVVSGYMPFAQTLLMANRPGWHTAVMVGSVASNVLFNWLLIPRMGITGAALGTGLALVVSACLLVAFVRARVGLRL
jgi:O-antigen/teichoic acid export membrane protein